MEQEKEKEKGVSVKHLIIFLGVLTVLAVGIWGYNLYRLKKVSFEGLTRYSEAEFLEELDGGFFTSLTPCFCLSDTFLRKEIPFIEKYEIDYLDRQTARIIVHEKRITGCVIVMGRYMFFDKDGIIVESADAQVEGVPVVTGLEFDEIVLYKPLKVQKQSLFDTILELARLIELNEIEADKIDFDANYEVTLQLEDISVLLGKKTNYDEQMNALSGILQSLQGRTGTLDMRNYSGENGEVIFKEP